MKKALCGTIPLLALLAAYSCATAQSGARAGDSLIEQSLRMVDLPPFTWQGAPEPLRPRLGLYVNPVPADSFKLIAGMPAGTKAANRVWHVMPHWSADEGGVLIGDIILALNGGPLADSTYAYDEYLNIKVRDMNPGDIARLTILRDGTVRELRVPVTPPAYVPMSFGSRGSALGPVRSDSWLARTLDQKGLGDWARNIQKQMRVICDQDFCVVPFAGRPNPWRLSDVTYLHNNPTRLGAYSRSIIDDLWASMHGTRGLQGPVGTAAVHLDQDAIAPNDKITSIATTADLTAYLDGIQAHLDKAYAPIRGDLDSIAAKLMRVLDMENNWEEQLDSVKLAAARRELRNSEESKLAALFGAVDKVRMNELMLAGMRAAALADSAWLVGFATKLGSAGALKPAHTEGIEGDVLLAWDTPAGRCVIGGKGANRYTGSFRLIIDLGGDDVYDLPPLRAGAVRFVADIAGDDIYRSSGSGQGAGVAGVDILADLAGNDTYRGVRYSQGAGLLGVGVLADFAGDDTYSSHWCSQGAAFQGVGLLFDGGGDDKYSADLYSQGFGYVRGFGAILERGGNDSYRAGWKYADNRIQHRGYLAMSQGFGFGMRPWSTGIGADGGIGVITDLHGDDVYASDFFSQGGSYWYALGILHDAEGIDRYTAGQYSQGSGIHLSFGALLDDEGDDTYDTYAGLEQGNAHDFSAGCLEDRQGNDTYRGSNSSQGSALNVSIAWLLDGGGNDQYYALLSDTTLSQGGGNMNRTRRSGALGMLLDIGAGNDYYVDPRAMPGMPVVKGNGILYDDGPRPEAPKP